MREQLYAELLAQIDKTDDLRKGQKRRTKRKLQRSKVYREYVLDSLTVELIGQGVVDRTGPQAAIDWSSIDWAKLIEFFIQYILPLFRGGD